MPNELLAIAASTELAAQCALLPPLPSRDGAEASRGQSPAGEVDDAASVTDEARLAKEGAAESGEQDGDNRKTESPDGGDGKGLEGAEEGAASGPSQDPQGMAQENGVCMYHTHVS